MMRGIASGQLDATPALTRRVAHAVGGVQHLRRDGVEAGHDVGHEEDHRVQDERHLRGQDVRSR